MVYLDVIFRMDVVFQAFNGPHHEGTMLQQDLENNIASLQCIAMFRNSLCIIQDLWKRKNKCIHSWSKLLFLSLLLLLFALMTHHLNTKLHSLVLS